MSISPGSSPADAVNPVTDCRQSVVSDCAETVITVANPMMATIANATANTPVVNLFIW